MEFECFVKGENNFPLCSIYAIIDEKLVRRPPAPGVCDKTGRGQRAALH